MDNVVLSQEQIGALRTFIEGIVGQPVLLDPEPAMFALGLRNDALSFGLTGDALEGAWAGPLILRLMPSDEPASAVERESHIYSYLAAQGYPVPELLAFESTGLVLGRPFSIMQRAPGIPIRRLLRHNPARVFRAASVFADAHVALHRLPAGGFPEQEGGPKVERQLAAYRTWLTTDDHARTLDWFDERAAAVLPEVPAVCHNNYHPVNSIVDGQLRVCVVDWSTADVGDRHSDVADALVFMKTEPVRERSRLRSRLVLLTRKLFVWRYLARYQQQYPLDEQRLCYWEALRAFGLRSTVSALAPTVLARSDVGPDTLDRQAEALGRLLRQKQRAFDGR